jgi:hypothetical protein
MMVFHVSRIASKQLVSPSVTVLDLHVPSLDFFLPGQWVDFVSQEKKGWVGRFSLASSPRDLPTVTLAVKATSKVPAQWVTLESKVGDAFEIQVGGNCVLEKDFEKSAVFCVSYHMPHQSQLNTQSSGLSPCTLSLLENPLAFFTNTCHPSQRYHLSFSTKKDCIFSRNTVLNIDVAPRLPVRHIIT